MKPETDIIERFLECSDVIDSRFTVASRGSLSYGIQERDFDVAELAEGNSTMTKPDNVDATEIQMTIRVATIADLPWVIELRMRLFAEYHSTLSSSDVEAVEHANRSFFSEDLDSSLDRTWLGEVDRRVVAAGTLAIFIRPPHPGNLEGKDAYLLNMYTIPEYRRRGLARGILSAATSYAGSHGIKRVWLHASESGRPLYESAGFQSSTAYMELKLT